MSKTKRRLLPVWFTWRNYTIAYRDIWHCIIPWCRRYIPLFRFHMDFIRATFGLGPYATWRKPKE